MALIVETGTGLTDADSYCSVAFADAYHASVGNTAWEALDNVDDKEPALRRATYYLDGKYGLLWRGEEYALGQALDWPRSLVSVWPERQSYLVGFTGYLDESPLPAALMRATAELALRSATGTVLSADTGTTGGQVVKRKKVGPLEVEYQDGEVSVVRFSAVEDLLSPLLRSTSSIRVVRG